MGVYVKKVSEYDQEISQSQHADNPVHRPEEPLNHHKTSGRQTKQCNQLSLPHQMIAIIEWTQSNVQQNIEHRTITDSHNHKHFKLFFKYIFTPPVKFT